MTDSWAYHLWAGNKELDMIDRIINEETTTVFSCTLSTRTISLVKSHNSPAAKLRITKPADAHARDGVDESIEATIRTEEDLRKLEALVKAARTVLEGDYGRAGAVDGLDPIELDAPVVKAPLARWPNKGER